MENYPRAPSDKAPRTRLTALARLRCGAGRSAGLLLLFVTSVTLQISFFGRGFFYQEATHFIEGYTDPGRGLAQKLFDPSWNDWGLYQGRELSYLVDWVDAHVFVALLTSGLVWLRPLSGLLGTLIILWVFWRWTETDPFWHRSSMRGLRVLALLVWVTSSTAVFTPSIFFRSSKMALGVILALLLTRRYPAVVGPRAWAIVSGLCFAMACVDRQGVAAGLLFSIGTLVHAFPHGATHSLHRTRASIAAAGFTGVVAGEAWNRVIGPRAIYWSTHQWPDLSYQSLRPDQLFQAGRAPLDLLSLLLSYWELFFGNLSWISAAALVAAATWVMFVLPASARAHAALLGAVVGLGIAGALLLMVSRHPIMLLAEVRRGYYSFPITILFLWGLLSFLPFLLERQSPRIQKLVPWVLAAFLIGNLVALPAHQRVIARGPASAANSRSGLVLARALADPCLLRRDPAALEPLIPEHRRLVSLAETRGWRRCLPAGRWYDSARPASEVGECPRST